MSYNNRRTLSKDVQLSKRLCWLLRHGAIKESLPLQPNGFIAVDAILNHKHYASYFNLETLQRLVNLDDKQRFSLRQNPINGSYEIRANQGHSLDTVEAEECLQRVENAADVPLAVHGTYYRHWPQICAEGLRCMGRTHVHFATRVDFETARHSEKISGFRRDCEILIYFDVQKAMLEGGMEIYRSANNVILCAGKNGCIPKDYFAKVIDRSSKKPVEFKH